MAESLLNSSLLPQFIIIIIINVFIGNLIRNRLFYGNNIAFEKDTTGFVHGVRDHLFVKHCLTLG